MNDHSQITGRQGNPQKGMQPPSATQTRWDFMIPPRYSSPAQQQMSGGHSLAFSGASNAPRLLRMWKTLSGMAMTTIWKKNNPDRPADESMAPASTASSFSHRSLSRFHSSSGHWWRRASARQ